MVRVRSNHVVAINSRRDLSSHPIAKSDEAIGPTWPIHFPHGCGVFVVQVRLGIDANSQAMGEFDGIQCWEICVCQRETAIGQRYVVVRFFERLKHLVDAGVPGYVAAHLPTQLMSSTKDVCHEVHRVA